MKKDASPLPSQDFLPKEMANLLNLSDKEKQIFDFLVKRHIGAKASTIAKETRMPLATVAFILRKLEKRKLISRFRIVSKRDFWKCERQIKNGQLIRQLGEKRS